MQLGVLINIQTKCVIIHMKGTLKRRCTCKSSKTSMSWIWIKIYFLLQRLLDHFSHTKLIDKLVPYLRTFVLLKFSVWCLKTLHGVFKRSAVPVWSVLDEMCRTWISVPSSMYCWPFFYHNECKRILQEIHQTVFSARLFLYEKLSPDFVKF